MPINIRIGGKEVPVGLFSVFLVLLATASVNLLTKSTATVSGIIFAGAFFGIFTFSEKQNARRQQYTRQQMKEHFQLEHEENIGREALQLKHGGVLVSMNDASRPYALKWALSRTDTDAQDVVVLTARMIGAGGPEYLDPSEQSFSDHEQMLFTKAVSVAESFGKHIALLVVPAAEIFTALVQTANSLEVAMLISGLSSTLSAAGAGLPYWPRVGEPAGAEAAVYLCGGDAGWAGAALLHWPPRACFADRRCAAGASPVAEYESRPEAEPAPPL